MPARMTIPIACAAASAAILASASAALAAPGIDVHALDVPSIAQLKRVGVAIVGLQSPESVAALDFTVKSLVAAGHPVTILPTLAVVPHPIRLLTMCVDRNLDAVALVRISTDATGWRVNVDIRDPEGAKIIVRPGDSAQHSPYSVWEAVEPVYATFSFAMSAADVAAAQQTRAQADAGDPAAAAADGDALRARPHLYVSEKMVMYGPARLGGAEFYRMVGRPDLAAAYEKNSSSIRIVRGFGYTALGIGGTTLALALVAEAFISGVCVEPNAIDMLSGQKATCGGNGGDSLFLIPLAVAATGGVLLGTAAAMTRDPLTLEERRALARDYNARADAAAEASPAPTRPSPKIQLGVGGAPLPTGNGGVMVLTGRF